MSHFSNRIFIHALLISIMLFILTLLYVLYPQSSGNRGYQDVKVATFSKNFINVHLLSIGDRHLLIDAGLTEFADDIEVFLRDHRLEPGDLEAIIVTHAHHDHAGAAKFFQEKFNVKIIGGKADLAAFQSGRNGTLCPTSLLAKARYGIDQRGRFPPVTPDVLVDDILDVSTITNLHGQIHSVPGHTEGSLVAVFGDVAFVGDIVRGGLLAKNKAAMHFYQCN